MVTFSIRDEIVEVINKLFVYTDMQEWEKLQAEIFSNDVFFDMSSMGGEKAETTSKAICETWKNGFVGIDSVNHLAGNYLIQIHDTVATVLHMQLPRIIKSLPPTAIQESLLALTISAC